MLDLKRRPRRALRIALVATVAGVVALGLVATLGWVILQRDPTGDAALAGPAPGRTVPSLVNGVFVGTSVKDADAYRKWFGADVSLVVDFSTRQTWNEIADPKEMINEWKGSGYRPDYSVGLLPDGDAGATIAAGARGDYDKYFGELAQRLVGAGEQNAILRIGWEFNLESSRWSSADPEAFIAYWRRVVTTMRAVPGQKFQFDWNPNNGKNKYDAVNYYPGDDVVDYVGIDAYDVSYAWHAYPYPKSCDAGCRSNRQQRAWDKSIYGGKRGLKFWAEFARRRGKPLSLPEWGLWVRDDGHGGGDDVYYLNQMHSFITNPTNGVAYQSYFEFDGADGPHRLMTTFPAAGKTFRTLFART
jgi:hypothetical protein